MQSPGRGYGIGELPPDLADFGDRHEGRGRHQHQQRQPLMGEPALGGKHSPQHGHREAAEAHRDLQAGGLCGQIVQ